MGTNYYAVRNRPSQMDPIHIGKSSMGWMFLFHRQNDSWRDIPVTWNTYNQVKDWLKKYTVDDPKYVIINEYDEIISFDDFIKLVESKQNDPICQKNPDNFRYDVQNVDGYRFMGGEFS